jgi:hypothetical protein
MAINGTFWAFSCVKWWSTEQAFQKVLYESKFYDNHRILAANPSLFCAKNGAYSLFQPISPDILKGSKARNSMPTPQKMANLDLENQQSISTTINV